MKNLLLRTLLVATLLYHSNVSGQILGGGFTLGPGLGCNAAQTSPVPGSADYIELPFPHGLTFAEFTHFSTKFLTNSSNNISFKIRFLMESGLELFLVYVSPSSPNTWQETGNLLTGNQPNIGGKYFTDLEDYFPYFWALYIWGSERVSRVLLVDPYVNGGLLKIDETRINNLLITYDDCNNNGVIDYYECNASTPQSDKRYVCHNGNTICVSSNAVNAHINHGDYLGPCQVNQAQPISRAIKQTRVLIKPKEMKINSFPNPVVLSMKISYELPTDSRINIELLDASGKAIPIIANEQKKAGIYDHVFDATKLPPGLYYCRISAVSGGKTSVKGVKVIVN